MWRVRGTWLWHISRKSYPFLDCIRDVKRSNIHCTTMDDDYPIIYRVLTIPGFSAGFRPSTVCRINNFQLRCCLSVFVGGKISLQDPGCVPPNPRQHWFWEDLSRNCNWDLRWKQPGEDWRFGLVSNSWGFWGTFFLERKKWFRPSSPSEEDGMGFYDFFIHIKFVLILGSKDVWNIYIKSTPHIVRMHSPFRC